MISCQKYALSIGFSSPIMLDRSEPCRGRFSIFEKKVQFFPLKGKKLTPSHFVQKLAQIVGYGQTVIGIVQSEPRRWFSILIIIPERVQMKKSKSMKKKFQKFFSLPISLPWVSNYFPPPRGFREVCWTRPPVYENCLSRKFLLDRSNRGGEVI